MEVEVKIRLFNEQQYKSVAALMPEPCLKVEEQTNTFLDGLDSELGNVRAVMRVRFDANATTWTLTLKSKALLVDGISRVQEEEERLPEECARALLNHPSEAVPKWSSSVGLLATIEQRFQVKRGWKRVGEFKTHREKYAWQGYTLELDETTYDFGKGYEIEIETMEPEEAKAKLESLLKQHNIPYVYSTRNKFVNMLKQSLDE